MSGATKNTFQNDATVNLPSLKEEFASNLDINDPFFDSLKKEYCADINQRGFEEWFKGIQKAGRKCYVHYQGKAIAALLVLKVEYESIECTPPLAPKKRLKLCLFKAERSGNRIGELFIKQSVLYCLNNQVDEMYLTHFTKEDDSLAKLIFEYGFQPVGRKENGEDVYLKNLIPEPEICKTVPPIEMGRRFYPTFYDGTRVRKFIVPIIPKYHSRLFTDFNGRQTAIEEFCGDFIIEGNTIKKAYLSHSPTKKLRQGDILLFYRSRDIHSITSLGVLEQFFWSSNPQEIYDKVRNRTVYPFGEIQEIAKKPTLVLLFRFHFHFPVININKLKEMKVLSSAPLTMREIAHTAYLKIKQESQLNERYTVD